MYVGNRILTGNNEFWQRMTTRKETEDKFHRHFLGQCMCQIVIGVGNTLNTESDMEIHDQVGGGGLGAGRQSERETPQQVEDQSPTMNKDEGIGTHSLIYSFIDKLLLSIDYMLACVCQRQESGENKVPYDNRAYGLMQTQTISPVRNHTLQV